MKSIKLSLIIALAIGVVSCANESSDTVNADVVNNSLTASEGGEVSGAPVMEFEKEIFDFGTIAQGEKVNFIYKFTNTGDADLIISSAKGSCGCTVPDWEKK